MVAHAVFCLAKGSETRRKKLVEAGVVAPLVRMLEDNMAPFQVGSGFALGHYQVPRIHSNFNHNMRPVDHTILEDIQQRLQR